MLQMATSPRGSDDHVLQFEVQKWFPQYYEHFVLTYIVTKTRITINMYVYSVHETVNYYNVFFFKLHKLSVPHW